MEFDLIVRNGTIVDGTGRPRFRADLDCARGRSPPSPRRTLQGQNLLDADGLAVAPGFVDVHSHADWILPLSDHDAILAPLLLQGVTTVVTGHCGFSPAPVTDADIPLADAYSEMVRDRAFDYRWRSFGEFLPSWTGRLAAQCRFPGGPRRPALRRAGRLDGRARPRPTGRPPPGVRRAMAEGALGLSAGLAYAPGVFARNDELLLSCGRSPSSAAPSPSMAAPTPGSRPSTAR